MFWNVDPREKAVKLFRSKKYDYFFIEFMLYVVKFVGPDSILDEKLHKFNFGLEDIHFEKNIANVYSESPRILNLCCAKFQGQKFKFEFIFSPHDSDPEKRHFVTILFFLDEKLVVNAHFMGVVDQFNKVWYSHLSLDEFHHSEHLLDFLGRQVKAIQQHERGLEQIRLAENHKKFTF